MATATKEKQAQKGSDEFSESVKKVYTEIFSDESHKFVARLVSYNGSDIVRFEIRPYYLNKNNEWVMTKMSGLDRKIMDSLVTNNIFKQASEDLKALSPATNEK